jgi:hypothetical protein
MGKRGQPLKVLTGLDEEIGRDRVIDTTGQALTRRRPLAQSWARPMSGALPAGDAQRERMR